MSTLTSAFIYLLDSTANNVSKCPILLPTPYFPCQATISFYWRLREWGIRRVYESNAWLKLNLHGNWTFYGEIYWSYFLEHFFSLFLTDKRRAKSNFCQKIILLYYNLFILIVFLSNVYLRNAWIHHKEQFKRTCFQINAHNM